jgi:hypothetical protein
MGGFIQTFEQVETLRATATKRWLENSGPLYRDVVECELLGRSPEKTRIRLAPGGVPVTILRHKLSFASDLMVAQARIGAMLTLKVRVGELPDGP